VYVPAQHTGRDPAALMVFQDGHLYLDPDGDVRAGAVIDQLIAGGEMPVAIGVFVDPGPDRNLEYDAFDDAYATFLLTAILPSVLAEYNVTDDPDQWAIGGGSSGGNCAFTVAWMRPDRFRRVFSSLGSFVQIPGGNPYPRLIEETPKQPLRVFLHAATNDLNWGPRRNWLAANLRVAAALAERAPRDRGRRARAAAHRRRHAGCAALALAPLGSRTDGAVPPVRLEAERLRAA
jgi:enterochelin esterase family protein